MSYNDKDELDLDALAGALGGVPQEFGEENARKNQIAKLKEMRVELTQNENTLDNDELSEEELEKYTAGISRR